MEEHAETVGSSRWASWEAKWWHKIVYGRHLVPLATYLVVRVLHESEPTVCVWGGGRGVGCERRLVSFVRSVERDDRGVVVSSVTPPPLPTTTHSL